MVITTSVETLDGLWLYCYTSCMLGRDPQRKEALPDFCEIWIPINRTQQCGIGSFGMDRNSAG